MNSNQQLDSKLAQFNEILEKKFNYLNISDEIKNEILVIIFEILRKQDHSLIS